MRDQREIVKNLPDGVLICRHLIDISSKGDFPSTISPEPSKTQIKFYNTTFRNLFGLSADFTEY